MIKLMFVVRMIILNTLHISFTTIYNFQYVMELEKREFVKKWKFESPVSTLPPRVRNCKSVKPTSIRLQVLVKFERPNPVSDVLGTETTLSHDIPRHVTLIRQYGYRNFMQYSILNSNFDIRKLLFLWVSENSQFFEKNESLVQIPTWKLLRIHYKMSLNWVTNLCVKKYFLKRS